MPIDVLEATPRVMNALKKAEGIQSNLDESLQDVHPTPDDGGNINTLNGILVPVRIVSGNGVAGYICDVFENGLNNPATKQGRVFLANGNSTIYVLPAGTVMYAQLLNVTKMGSNN